MTSRYPLRVAVALALSALVLALAGASARAAGSWDFASRIPAGTSLAAATAGQLTLYLHNVNGTLLAGIERNDPGEPVAELAGGQALVVWTQQLGGDGQALVGVARSDVAAITALFSDGSSALLPLDSLNGFSETTGDARLVDLEAVDATGATVGEITVAPTGNGCAETICRLLTTNSAGTAAAASTGTPLYGLFSTPQSGLVRLGKGGKLPPIDYGGGTTIARVNPKTFAPTGKKLRLPNFFFAQAFSPNGDYVLGSNQNTLTIVNLKQLTENAHVEARLAADLGSQTVHALSWPSNDRLLVVVQRFSEPYQRNVVSRTLLGIDPMTGSIVWKRTLTKKLRILNAQTVAGKLILQLGDSSLRRTNETLVIASPDGHLRSSTVDIPKVNSQLQEARLVTTDSGSPGAYLVAASGTVFSIDLDTAGTTAHHVAAPAGAPTSVPSPYSNIPDAVALGANIVAGGLFTRPNGKPRTGIYLIDTRNWTARLLDRKANHFTTDQKQLITYSSPGLNPADPLVHAVGTGITIYGQNGVRLHHLYGQRKFASVGITPRFAYAFAFKQTKPRSAIPLQTGERLVFDPTTGKSLGHNASAFASSPRLISPGTPLNNNG
ncbi:MAG TPA: hypothetical protein VGL76_08070 [Gaiellaceae bacterium]